MVFWRNVARWWLAGFPILGINFVAMMAWGYIVPMEIAYWIGFTSASPATYVTWKFIENWKT